jgi:hypothetical protein
MSDSTRYTLLLDQGAVKAVERLQRTYDVKNKAEVYDLAIRVLTWVTDQQINGYEIGRSKGDEFQPLLVPYTLNKQAWIEGTAAKPADSTQRRQRGMVDVSTGVPG